MITIVRMVKCGMPSFERCVVLVADDEPGILQLVSYVLTRHGYEVIAAPNGSAALRACQERDGPIHLALLDIVMPGMSGPELSQHLHEIHPNLPVVYMSGYQPEQLPQYAPALKSANFIPKPFRPRDIVQRVNETLGNTDVCALLDDEVEAVTASV